jgi:hypothetical protein
MEILLYRHDERVMHINGTNIQPQNFQLAESYYFSRYAHVWGFATWRRVWQSHDPAMSAWRSARFQREILQKFTHADERRYWKRAWDGVMNGKIQTWDYPLMLTLIQSGCVAITPAANLVSNIGFGSDALHTRNPNSKFSNIPLVEMQFPLRHPQQISIHQQADEYSSKSSYRWLSLYGRYKKMLRWRIRKLLGIAR